MKKISLALIPLLLASSLCAAAPSSKLDQFNQVNSRFYSFDPQAFQSISCAIDLPLLDNEITALNSYLTGKAVFDATLNSYRLVYKSPRELSIHDPELSIEVITKKIADPARLKLGISQVKQGFKGQVEGVDTQLKALLEGFEPIERDKLHIDDISRSDGGYTLHYQYQGLDIVDVISGNTVTSTQHQSGVAVTSVENYRPAPSGKLLLQHATVHEKNALGREDFGVTMTYQNLGEVIFPKAINVSGQLGLSLVQQQVRLDYTINLADCQIK
ncbi:MAG: hypothetical protein ACRER1_08940 [Gammaproteobacteria bacterium]